MIFKRKACYFIKKVIRRCIAILIVLMIAMPLTSCSKKEQEIDKTMTVQATVIEIEKYGHAVLDIAEAVEELEQIDLEASVTTYLVGAGMLQEDILLLKEKLG